jgi:hypothetical protein
VVVFVVVVVSVVCFIVVDVVVVFGCFHLCLVFIVVVVY